MSVHPSLLPSPSGPRLLSAGELDAALAIPDLTDPAYGPHAVQLMVGAIVQSLQLATNASVVVERGTRIVTVADNYDVTFITQLLYDVEARLCIDTSRVFAAGMSNGAQMSSLLSCRLPDRVAAIAQLREVRLRLRRHVGRQPVELLVRTRGVAIQGHTYPEHDPSHGWQRIHRDRRRPGRVAFSALAAARRASVCSRASRQRAMRAAMRLR